MGRCTGRQPQRVKHHLGAGGFPGECFDRKVIGTKGSSVDIVKGNMGWIEVVVGPMFSGKSEELIRRLRRAEFARQRVQIFKPAIDERYAADEIVSHSGLGIQSECVNNAAEVMAKVQPRTEVVGIDEAQFLGEEIVDVCTKLA